MKPFSEELLHKVAIGEVSLLQTLCMETYKLYFGDYWEKDGLETYLEEQFSSQRLYNDLKSEQIEFYFIAFQGKLVGYMKINYNSKLDVLMVEPVCELEKMYLKPEFLGRGIGKNALKQLARLLGEKGIKNMFLGVLDSNRKAILFYTNAGFRFHSKTRLKYQHFKEALKGLDYMVLELSKKSGP